jgi:xanthine/uracil permease
MTEGVGCFIGALIGGGTSLTTYSENLGAIGITRASFHAFA